jgi:hypothetical protein
VSDTAPEGGQMARYDLVTNYRCGSAIEEMEPSDDGEWVRYEDIQSQLAAQSSRLRSLEQRLRDLEGKWRRDADHRGGSLSCGACKTECADELSTLIDQG